ncbi:P-loop containing nucleoside triphosphate hydrolase protein [Mycena metata]|uniref:P-loop containing nucleoside triphosphate hydrolase protein n=1 Tax=Mycena metata TaxID=1033252 RepID=A0AAD7I4W6_9AGAR|nr:P-loop containing nucleoside triphosphate hydrolase protein [Mycena metata]
MFSLNGDSRSLHISGGHGGSGGPAHLQGGTGGVGQGPIVHITASPLITHNLQATVATDQALRLDNIRAAQIASHCPPASRIFCGREDVLNKMHQFFSDTGIQHIYVLHGLGGAGKTQIALKFINGSSSRFSDIFFIDTSTIATIETGLKNIAVLKEFGNSPQDGLLWLTSKVEEWLLLFDNADDPGINLNDYIPQCNHGNIIITSRNPEMCVYAGSDSLVSDMEEEDAVTLLLKSALQKATSHTEQIAAEIVKALHYLPLAVVQAGAFISKSRNLDGYLALYMKNQAQLLSEKPAQSHDRYAWTVYTTWQMSFDRLTPPAAMLLQHCSFLHYNGISEEIFRYASRYQFPSGGPSKEEIQEPLEFLSRFLRPTGEWDSLQFFNTINEIQSYSLISFDVEKKLFSIHPLVHAWSQATVQNPRRHVSIVGSILGMAMVKRSQWDMQLTSLLLCPHIELAVQMDTEVALTFRSQYALIFWEGGKYKHAEELLEEVLQKQKQFLGEDHPDTLFTMGNLGNSYSALGEHQKAKELISVVLEKQKQFLGEDHPNTLFTMGNLANSYSALREHQRAQDLISVVLEKRKQVLGENHPHTLRAMRNLAISYSALGEHEKAKGLKSVVLEKQTQFLGKDHPDTLLTIGNLGNSYSALGDHQRAQELKSAVLEKQKQVLGENHPETLFTMGNLASSYSDLGEHQKAKDLEIIVLEKRKQVLGEHEEAKGLMGIVLEKQKPVLGVIPSS